MKKKKILMLSDHLLSTSGVGCQSRYLAFGLAQTDRWTIRQFGAAIKHTDYSVVQPHPEIVIKPVDGFGTQDMIRTTLAMEKPDILLIFTPKTYNQNTIFTITPHHFQFNHIIRLKYN